jgi:putative ATP-dependent endonuclease of the OLD family
LEGNNLKTMSVVQLSLVSTNGPVRNKLESFAKKDWTNEPVTAKADAAFWLLKQLDKGDFAQQLAKKLSFGKVEFSVPDYIKKAIEWVVK